MTREECLEKIKLLSEKRQLKLLYDFELEITKITISKTKETFTGSGESFLKEEQSVSRYKVYDLHGENFNDVEAGEFQSLSEIFEHVIELFTEEFHQCTPNSEIEKSLIAQQEEEKNNALKRTLKKKMEGTAND